MLSSRYLAVVLGFLAAACGHTGQPASAFSPGDAAAPPSLLALPSIPDQTAADTRRVHDALALAQRGLDQAMPPPPEDRCFPCLQAWIDSEVVEWLSNRNQVVSDMAYLLSAEQGAEVAEQAVGKAAVGLLQEDTSRSLRTIPVPDELATEPEVAKMFVGLVESQARPILAAAVVAFRECSDLAFDGPPDTARFTTFCNERFSRLRATFEEPGTLASGQTVVTVVPPSR